MDWVAKVFCPFLFHGKIMRIQQKKAALAAAFFFFFLTFMYLFRCAWHSNSYLHLVGSSSLTRDQTQARAVPAPGKSPALVSLMQWLALLKDQTEKGPSCRKRSTPCLTLLGHPEHSMSRQWALSPRRSWNSKARTVPLCDSATSVISNPFIHASSESPLLCICGLHRVCVSVVHISVTFITNAG